MAATFQACGKSFPLTRTYVMGILNFTPDSFSDGGRYFTEEEAYRKTAEMLKAGADIIDVGAQSTRPGHTEISAEEEWERLSRVLPGVLRETEKYPEIAVSVDTFYPEIAQKALELGAHIINDVKGFPDEMFRAVASTGCGCIVMHPQGSQGGEILTEIKTFFEQRLEAARQLGVESQRLCFDPGIGFGKTLEENLRLIGRGKETKMEGMAYLMAASKKRVTGEPCGNPPFDQRLPATIAVNTAAILSGADIVRVHDVAEAVQSAKMTDALRPYFT